MRTTYETRNIYSPARPAAELSHLFFPPGPRPGQLHPGQGRPTSPAEAGRHRPVPAPTRTLPVPDLLPLQWICAEYLEKNIHNL